ncbi:hypothetical protein C4J81_10480 [Deltaproteobacteria bacterium Smac51]|nr:hypothetical protein C4J81_10480 [Deltaproteobacteria bacterium Smac51]
MIVKILLVDACTDGLFSGGTAAVAFLRHLGQEVFLQALADELGFPVTVYVLPHQDEFITRCFSPSKGEINANSFAALAAAHAIYGVGLAPVDKPVTLHGRGGSLTLFKDPAQPEGSISLNLGGAKTTAAPPSITERLNDVLGLAPANILKAEYLGVEHLLVSCRELEAMESIDFRQIPDVAPQARLTLSAPLESSGTSGYAVRCFGADGVLDSSPMCLAIHSVLGPLWAAQLKKAHLEIHYISPRTCRMWLDQSSDGSLVAAGQVNTVFRADPVLRELTGEVAPDMFF